MPRKPDIHLILAGVAAAGLVLYQDAFAVQPSADDFILARQIRVGDTQGAWTFFTSSPLSDYRPLQSLVYWAAGRWNADDPFPLIHILNFAACGFYAWVFALWLRLLQLPRVAVVAAAAALLFHPLLTGPLVDLDGFPRFVVTGWVWLGAFCAFRYADRLPMACALTGACLAIGLGFMEYAVALILLGPAAMWWSTRGRGRAANAAILSAALVAVFAVYYALRLSIIDGDSGRLSTDLLQWAGNVAMLAGAVLFMGDTVSAYVSRDAAALAALAASSLVMSALVAGGLWLWWTKRDGLSAANEPVAAYRAATFLPVGFVLSFFPMVVMQHVSEIYATPIVFAFALATGTAMAGWGLSGPRYRRGSVAVLAVMLLWASSSVVRKVSYLKDTGQRADVQIQSLLAAIPEQTQNARVALVFFESELPPRRTYSVFRGGDDHLIQPGDSAQALIEWFRPGQGLELVHSIVPDDSQVPYQNFDLLLRWEPQTRRFRPLAALAPDDAVARSWVGVD